MSMITPEQIVGLIQHYFDGGMAEYLHEDEWREISKLLRHDETRPLASRGERVIGKPVFKPGSELRPRSNAVNTPILR